MQLSVSSKVYMQRESLTLFLVQEVLRVLFPSLAAVTESFKQIDDLADNKDEGDECKITFCRFLYLRCSVSLRHVFFVFVISCNEAKHVG